MEYTKYAHYVSSCKYHIVFCPKYRRNILVNGIDARLKEIILSLQKDRFHVIEMEVMPNHVHLLIEASPYESPVDIVKHIKQQSALILKREFKEINTKLPNLWTRSAFICSVGTVSMEIVKEYIANQKGR